MTEIAPPTPSRAPSRMFAAIAPLIILAASLVGFALFIGWPAWPVIDAGERIAYSAIVATLLASVAAIVRCCWTRLGLNLLAALACVVPALLPMVRPDDWSYGQLALWTTAVCVPAAILASLAQRLRERDGTALALLVTLGMTLAGAALLMSTGSLKLGQAGFSAAAGVLIVVIVGIFAQGIGRSSGAITLAFALLAGLLTSGYVWSELPLWAGLCVWAAPVIVWVVRVPVIAKRRAWLRVIVGLVLAAIPAATAVAILALKASRASESDEYGY